MMHIWIITHSIKYVMCSGFDTECEILLVKKREKGPGTHNHR